MSHWNEVLRVARTGNPAPPRRVEKSSEEWRALLSPESFRVTRTQGTERPFSSAMCELFEPGIYLCVCCETPLFDSQSKFDSGTGWPSFSAAMAANVVSYHEDTSHGMSRVETTCSVCDAHLGHVFPDGPRGAGGLRFCINAAALKKQSTG
ncbi:MAG: peptide-methionine (R)-S-oxide reductase MsrB [Deltaproteobacteria bacterium]|nr:peptide-methionine (R)-S-oxide reductase MsrB [Deltaproteobacteria bacterium]